jgi:hypothetical protein
MKNIPELDKLFDLPLTEDEKTHDVPAIVNDSTQRDLDQDEDYQLARNTLRGLIHKSGDTLDQMIELAKSSEHPRTYEVAGQLIKTVSDVAKDLLELQKKAKDLQPSKTEGPRSITNNNVVFAGSTAELMKMLKNNNDGNTIEQ